MSESPADEILIQGLNVQARIGCTAEERANPQVLQFYLRIDIGRWSTPAVEGSMDSTVCYADIAAELQRFAERREWVLIEELAAAAIDSLFSNHDKIESIDLEIRKRSLPNADYAGVRFVRKRG